MSKRVQIRRGTTLQHSSFTGATGEVTVDTDKKCVVVHDGATAGGHPINPGDMVSLAGPGDGNDQTIATGGLKISGSNGTDYGLTVVVQASFQDWVYVNGVLLPSGLRYQGGAITYAASVSVSLNTAFQTIALTGNLTIAQTAGRASGAYVTLRIVADGSLRNLTFTPAWVWIGSAAPASIAANKTGLLELWCYGGNETDIVARWTVQP
jgi:hypothetical protein